MRWLITGASGQLGRDVVDFVRLQRSQDQIFAPGRRELDLSSFSSISSAIQGTRPDVVVNCAAWTDVDGAEEREDEAHVINALAPEVMATHLADLGSGILVQVSTDYVFNGQASAPYSEDSPLSPLSAYGRTKATGEVAVQSLLPDRSLVVRTAWLYSPYGKNFVKTIAQRVKAREALAVVDDQWGHPTWSRDVAQRIFNLVAGATSEEIPFGVYHAVNCGITSWWGLATRIAELLGDAETEIPRISTESLDRPATRPPRVQLQDRASASLGVPEMPPWDQSLERVLMEASSDRRR